MKDGFVFRTAFALLACMTANTLAQPGAGAPPAERLLAEKSPLVIAHRGYSARAPENTLPALQTAVRAGAHLVELDYHHTKDGVPVVIHDYDLDRTTDAAAVLGGKKIRVDSETMARLQTLDAGKWFGPGFAGTRLPSLVEALDAIQQLKGVTLIERKAGDAATCARILREKNLVNQVVVQAFDWDYLKDFHRIEPRQILGALGPPSAQDGRKLADEEKILSPKWNDMVRETGAKAVVWNRNVTPEAVRDAHGKGLKVWVYTINEAGLADKLLGMGVDGIITDDPSVIFPAVAVRERK